MRIWSMHDALHQIAHVLVVLPVLDFEYLVVETDFLDRYDGRSLRAAKGVDQISSLVRIDELMDGYFSLGHCQICFPLDLVLQLHDGVPDNVSIDTAVLGRGHEL